MSEEPVLINPPTEGFTLMMASTAGTASNVSVPARFWSYREVPNDRVQEFIDKHGWARCHFTVASPTRIISESPVPVQVQYTKEPIY